MTSWSDWWWGTTPKAAEQESAAVPPAPQIVLKTPGVARNAPTGINPKTLPPSAFVVSHSQIEQRRANLRHVETVPRQVVFPPRSPVLRELLAKTQKL